VLIKAIRSLGLMMSFVGLSGTVARAQAPGSRTYFNQDIFVAQGQQIHNATCIFCSVQVEGDLTGHVFVLFGSLNVTGRIERGATVIGGNAVIDSQARIGGNALVVGGNAVRRASLAGRWAFHSDPLHASAFLQPRLLFRRRHRRLSSAFCPVSSPSSQRPCVIRELLN
jgi:hypothetical protein